MLTNPIASRRLAYVALAFALCAPTAVRAQSGVSSDRVSVPDGPGSMEGLGDNATLDRNMGLMSYQVAFELPAGFPQATPSLAVAYSTGTGNSVVGIGWTLTTPSIERMTLRGLPSYTAADELVADGRTQLVRISMTGTTAVYRPRFEGDFVRTTWHDAGAAGYFTAEYPDGSVGYFGATAAGVLVPDARLSGDDGRTFRYHLVEKVDAHALEHAFRATRLLEYYKSQSYANSSDLYLIRMVSRGQYNLDDYLDALEDDYEAFRGQYRNRSHRAVRLSMANDIMHIPTLGNDGHALSTDERARLLRARLLDPTRLDAHGRRTYEFRTSLDQFAPCTFGHQIDYVEIMFSGANLGDPNASVMLWQDGTGVIERADQGQNFHRLPPSLIVATPRRDLDAAFDPSVYRNYQMRERPLVNTSWRLVFDEQNPQNGDVRFDQLNDIFIYIYYTDFTNPDACR